MLTQKIHTNEPQFYCRAGYFWFLKICSCCPICALLCFTIMRQTTKAVWPRKNRELNRRVHLERGVCLQSLGKPDQCLAPRRWGYYLLSTHVHGITPRGVEHGCTAWCKCSNFVNNFMPGLHFTYGCILFQLA